MSIQRSLIQEALKRNALEQALDRLPVGVAIVNRDREILIMNKVARNMCAPEGGLTKTHNRLGASSKTDTEQLKLSVANAMSDDSEQRGGVTKGLSIHRPSGSTSLTALVIPIHIETGLAESQRAAAVFVADPERAITVEQDWLKDMFELTAAEARLASLLVDGFSLSEVAEILNVSLNTVRTHLKRIFAKTGTRRQAELVRVVLTSVTQVYQSDDELVH